MTKEQKIQEVYESHGFSWIQAKEYVDESGWSKHRIGNCKALTNKRCGVSWRPEELYGLDKNNGWIKIESDDDLPKEDCHCWILDKEKGLVTGMWKQAPTKQLHDQACFFWKKRATHYQIIIKPQDPMY